MARRLKLRPCALAALLLFALAHPADLSSCGPFFPQPVFTNTLEPDGPGFGIMQPSYKRQYLVLAYRAMQGLPEANEKQSAGEPDAQTALDQWLDARKQVASGQKISVQLYRSGPAFEMIPNCLAGAFDTARQTLARYISDFGAAAADTKSWLAAQDDVFANCGGGPLIPAPAPANTAPGVAADRAYQIAAAQFYAAQFDVAKAAFEAIAEDQTSRWQKLAAYLVARVELRQGHFPAAAARLQSILSDPAQSALHATAQSLLDYTNSRIDPAARLLLVSRRLQEPQPVSFARDLEDYSFLYDKFDDVDTNDKPQLGRVAAEDDLTNWIFTFQEHKPDSLATLVSAWKTKRSLPWLIAALHQAAGRDASAPELVEAANQVSANSPAYATARFESVRLLIESGDTKQAAAELHSGLLIKGTFDASTSNAFRAERLKVAESFEVFLANAPRSSRNDNGTKTIAFDADATRIFNQSLPQSLWLAAIRDVTLDASLRDALVRAGWVRGVLLGRNESAFGAPPAASGFDAIFWLLHHPESQPFVRTGAFERSTANGRIDNLRDNWWCPAQPGNPPGAGVDYQQMASELTGILPRLYPPDQPPHAQFLNAVETAEAESEQRTLAVAGGGPFYLTSQVLAWAKAHPSDPRNAEALALAVKTSRFGCPTPDSTPLEHAAFDLLHQRYPQTVWAKRTPYWY